MATLNPANTLDDFGEAITDLDAALAAAVDLTNDFFNDGNLVLVVSNGGGGPVTATVKGQPDPYSRGGAGVGDVANIVPAGKIGIYSLLNPAMFNGGGKTTFTLSATASVKIGVIRLRKLR
jgi:hypothetical protein